MPHALKLNCNSFSKNLGLLGMVLSFGECLSIEGVPLSVRV